MKQPKVIRINEKNKDRHSILVLMAKILRDFVDTQVYRAANFVKRGAFNGEVSCLAVCLRTATADCLLDSTTAKLLPAATAAPAVAAAPAARPLPAVAAAPAARPLPAVAAAPDARPLPAVTAAPAAATAGLEAAVARPTAVPAAPAAAFMAVPFKAAAAEPATFPALSAAAGKNLKLILTD